MNSIWRYVVILAAGLAHAASMGAPWDSQPQAWLQLLALGILAWQLDVTSSPRQAAWLGWLFTTAWLCGTFWWLYISMHTYGGLNAVLTALAILGLAAVLALYYAAACAVFVAVKPTHKAWSAIIFAALWMLAEMARSVLFTGFGWGAAAYAHVDGLAIFAKYAGAYGVCALAALLAYAGMVCLRRPFALNSVWAVGLFASVAALAIFPKHEFSSPGQNLDVVLLQGNIAQDEKFQPGSGIKDALFWYRQQLASAKGSLIVAPETAIPILPVQLPEGYWDDLVKPFARGNQALLVGIPLGSYSEGYTNSVLGIKPDAAPIAGATPSSAYRYDKHHLVPFGEFIPPFFKWFTQMMNIPLGDFNRGAIGQPSFDWQGQRLAPNICYEDLFGEELGARFLDPEKAPTIFVNVSNIGWFGNTIAIDQHLNISRMRALEFERPFIRATNTGATVIIDHNGRVTHSLPRHTRGILTGQVHGRTGAADNSYGITPFAWWVARFGLWPLWIAGLGIVLLAVVGRLRRA